MGITRLTSDRLRRREDPRFLRGRGQYVDDLSRPGTLHVAFFRSDVAHARIKSISTDMAQQIPGVLGVYTAKDLEGKVKSIVASVKSPSYQVCEWPVLAREKVRFVGESLAAVVGNSRYEAEDGVDSLSWSYESLPSVVDVHTALKDGATQIHDSVAGNVYNAVRQSTGDVDAAFKEADHCVEYTFRSQRIAPMCMETRAVLAEWGPDKEDLSVWCSHQAPHVYRRGLSDFLSFPESRIRVVAPDIGGAFGAKMVLYPEDLVVIAIARMVGRPMRWTSDRREDLLSGVHSRDQVHRVEIAARSDGQIIGLRAEIKANNGAYAPWPITAALDSGQAATYMTGPYKIDSYQREAYAVATNKAPLGPYRGVGRVLACFTIERAVDELARELNLDPLEIRRRNVIREYPYDTATGLQYDGGSSAESLDKIEEVLELPKLRKEQRILREAGIYRGIGFAASIEHAAIGQGFIASRGLETIAGKESALVRAEPDGTVTVLVGTHSHGQGHETTFAQLTSRQLGIPIEGVRIRYGDTAMVQHGMGTWGSRSMVYAGGAITLATEDIVKKVLSIAAHHLEVAYEDLEYSDGQVRVRGVPNSGVSFAEVAHIAHMKTNLLPIGIDPGLESLRYYCAPDPGSFSNTLHATVIEVDVDTGLIKILRYVVLEDCGPVVNQMIVDGQVHGAVAQGLGHALLEDISYDTDGQPVNSTLMDYLVPSFMDVPPSLEIYHEETPSVAGIGGFKGMAEGGSINAPAALANAVADALSPFGVFVYRTPLTPEWIVQAVARARANSE